MQNSATTPITWNPPQLALSAAIETSFTAPFQTRFRSGSQLTVWQHQLDSTYQGPIETVDQYAIRLRELIRRVYPDNDLPVKAQVSMFTKGLLQNLQFYVRPANQLTMEDAINVARSFEDSYKSVNI